MKTHTSAWKKEQLTEIKRLAEKYPIIAVADLTGFPANLFQDLRKKLQGKAEVKVSKMRVIKKALEETKLKETPLMEKIQGNIAIVFTEMNPFELFAFLKKNKGSASAKAGAIAPEDIIIPAGDTGLPPGPALSDLKNAGLKVKVEGSTIAITEDCVVTKKGEAVTPAVAGTLSKLDIKPIKVGLNLVAAVENQELFLPEVLDIDIEKVFQNFSNAYRNSLALSLEIGYFTAVSTPLLIAKAFREAKALALEADIFTKETVGLVLAKAEAQAKALKERLPEAPEAPPAEAKEEKKEEEKKE